MRIFYYQASKKKDIVSDHPRSSMHWKKKNLLLSIVWTLYERVKSDSFCVCSKDLFCLGFLKEFKACKEFLLGDFYCWTNLALKASQSYVIDIFLLVSKWVILVKFWSNCSHTFEDYVESCQAELNNPWCTPKYETSKNLQTTVLSFLATRR